MEMHTKKYVSLRSQERIRERGDTWTESWKLEWSGRTFQAEATTSAKMHPRYFRERNFFGEYWQGPCVVSTYVLYEMN